METGKSDILWRIRLVYVFIALFSMLIIGRVAYVQFVEGDHWREMAQQATMRYVSIDAARGDIRADDGRLLATSIPVYEIRMDLGHQVIGEVAFHREIDSLCLHLSRLFKDRSQAQYRSELMQARRNQERYFLVKRNVSYHELNQLKQFPIFRHGRYKGGLIIIEQTRREMPHKTLAARTIGYERQGVYVGLEGAYRQFLEGIQGKRLMQRTSGGYWMPINDENEIQPKNGMDIFTTINIRMQDVAENALRNQLTRHEADYGTIVIMEVETGKIKAISNLSRNAAGFYEESFNFAVGESTEPGSTFKLATMMALLDDGLIKPADLVHTGSGQIRYHDRIMRDAREGGFGTITLTEAFALSSNVGISSIVNNAYKADPQKFINRIRAMGLDKPLGIEISGEGVPVIKDAYSAGWSATTLPWMAIGYELTMTPLQMLSLYNAVANNGRMMRPYFVEEIRQTGSVVKAFDPLTLNRNIASRSTIEALQQMLVEVVKNGTASNIHTSIYQIAGKTGTAQVAQTRHGYRSDAGVIYQASFAGYFPSELPAYSMIVVIHNPKGGAYTGSQLAAPVFREVADRIYATLLITPEALPKQPLTAALPGFKTAYTSDLRNIYSELNCKIFEQTNTPWATSIIKHDSVAIAPRKIEAGVVPDVSGMGLRDALYLLENSGLKVQFSGMGSVKGQSLLPGTRIAQNNNIYLMLN